MSEKEIEIPEIQPRRRGRRKTKRPDPAWKQVFAKGKLEKDAIVLGDSWAAMATVGFLATSGRSVAWIRGLNARIFSPSPALEWGEGVAVWSKLLEKMDLDGDVTEQPRSFLREFRNKAFRQPEWADVESFDEKTDMRDGMLWAPEARFVGAVESRFHSELFSLENQLREKIANLEEVTVIEGIAVQEYRSEDRAIISLGENLDIEADRVVFADQWSDIANIQGMPNQLPFRFGRQPMGALQADFAHKQPIGVGVHECFCGIPHRDTGEKFDRRILGYFSDDGMRSVWTVFFAEEEAEDNHLIGKKYRKLKQTLNRMFTGSEWLPEGLKEFTRNISEENVRFEEGIVFSEGEPLTEPSYATNDEDHRLAFLTDGYGPMYALQQVGNLLANDFGIDRSDLFADFSDSEWAVSGDAPVPSLKVETIEDEEEASEATV